MDGLLEVPRAVAVLVGSPKRHPWPGLVPTRVSGRAREGILPLFCSAEPPAVALEPPGVVLEPQVVDLEPQVVVLEPQVVVLEPQAVVL